MYVYICSIAHKVGDSLFLELWFAELHDFLYDDAIFMKSDVTVAVIGELCHFCKYNVL